MSDMEKLYKLDTLKREYVQLSLGTMVYGTDTKQKRQAISKEIERIEKTMT